MPRVVDAIAPPRLGPGFRWLIGSSWLTNLGDGIAIAAGALLIEAETGDPTLVGISWLLARLPWLLFGLHAGYLADRLDRRVVVMAANGVRVAALAVFALTIGADRASVPVIFVALFVLGTAEVFADNASQTLLPMLVPRRDLTLGNARLVFGFNALNQLVGPPVGALLFTVGMWSPFAAQAALVALGVVLVQRIVLSSADAGPPGRDPRSEITDGIRWLWSNAPIRTLALAIFFFNITFGAAFAVLVVLANERLGLDELGFGLLVSISALGGIVGTIVYRRTEARVGVVTIMRVGLMIEALTHLVLAVTTTAAWAFAVMFLFGIHASMWGTTSSSIRQAIVPNNFQGRVGSVYMVGLQGGLVAGAGLGALIAGRFGITGPYWFGFLGTVVVLVLIWRELATIAGAASVEPSLAE